MTRKPAGKKPARAPVPRKARIQARDSRGSGNLRPILQRAWWILRGVLAGVAAVVLSYGAWLGSQAVIRSPALSVKTITVDGCRDVEARTVRKLAGVREGVPLLEVDLEKVRRRIIRHPAIRDAVVVRRLPDTLVITVRERKGVAVLVGPGGYTLADEEAVVLGTAPALGIGYPLVTGAGARVEPGETSEAALPVIRAITLLSASGLVGMDRISEAWIENGAVHVSLLETGTLLILSPRHLDDDIERLGRLMGSALFDIQAAGYDLRFSGRVVRLPARSGEGV